MNREDIVRMSEEERLKVAEGIGDLPFDGNNKEIFKLLLGDESFRVRKMALESLLRTQQITDLISLFIESVDSQDNAGLRTAGVEGLTRIGKRAVKQIVDAINPEQWELSKLLVDVLGDIGDPEVIPILIKLTSNPQQNLSTSAIEALGKIGTQDVISHLVTLLGEKEVYILFSTLEALANLGKKGFALPIDRIVPLKDNPLLKKAVFDLLGSTRNPEVVKYLIEGIKDSKRSNRDAAAKALLQLYNELPESDRKFVRDSIRKSDIYDSYIVEKMLSSVDPSVVTVGIRLLGWHGGKGNLSTILKYADNPDITDACVMALEDIGSTARLDIVGLLVGNKSIAQLKAGLTFLSRLEDFIGPPPEGLSYIIDVIETEDLQILLAQALGTFIDVQSLKLLLKLITEENKLVNNAVIENFIKVGRHIPDQAIKIIHDIAHSSNHLLRLAGTRLIANFYNEGFTDDIKTLLNDSEPDVRAGMITTIGSLKLSHYLNDIQVALADEDRDVRIEAIRAIALIAPDKFIDTIKWLINDDDQWVKIEIINHLQHIPQSDEVRNILKLYANDPSPVVLLKAIEVLINTYPVDSEEDIFKALSNKDADVVQEVIYMLGKSKHKKAYEILKQISLSDNVKTREAALATLERYSRMKDF
ncbi:MAG: HEAT repeat domain-containing protein [bacterium]